MGKCDLWLKTGMDPLSFAKTLQDDLHELYHRRKIMSLVEDAYDCAFNKWTPDSLASITVAARELNEELIGGYREESTESFVNDAFNKEFERMEASIAGKRDERVYSNFYALDKIVGGFNPGNLIILGARPSMGKTAMALDIAWYHAKRMNFTVYYTLEMTRLEIAQRLLAKETSTDVVRLRKADLSELEIFDAKKLLNKREFSLYVDEANTSATEIELRLHRVQRKLPDFPIKLVIVDHLQIMGASDPVRYERRDRQVATYTSQLKDMAKRMNLVVLLLSQLNRSLEQRDPNNRDPRLSDFRDSGGIEEDADVVIGLSRPYQYTKNISDLNMVHIGILKNRNGPVGYIEDEVMWVPNTAKFVNKMADAPF